MNTGTELEAMLVITQAKYEQQQQRFQKLVSEENRLRSELARLDASARQIQTDTIGEMEMRSIGADIVWQGWVERAKTQLNLKLAQVLALKLHHLAQVKQSYGKVLVVKGLLEQAETKAKTKAARKVLAEAIIYSLHG